MSKTKFCNGCKKDTLLTFFGFVNKRTGVYKSRCNSCLAKAAVTQRANRKKTTKGVLYYKNQWLERRYGITLNDFDILFRQQGGLCAICKNNEWGKTGPVVDHHHSTHVIRAILCHKCNTALGLFREDPDSMNRAAMYILSHAATTPTGV